MEYSAVIYENKVKVKTVIFKEDICIEVEEKVFGKHIKWNKLKLDSLYVIQILNILLCELPYKFAAAIHIFNLNKKTECALHILLSTTTILAGLIENETAESIISVKELKVEVDVICYMLKQKMSLNMICNQMNVLLAKLQATRMACHIFLYFSYGEFLLTGAKPASTVAKEMWAACFNCVPCTPLLETFHMFLQKNFVRNISFS